MSETRNGRIIDQHFDGGFWDIAHSFLYVQDEDDMKNASRL